MKIKLLSFVVRAVIDAVAGMAFLAAFGLLLGGSAIAAAYAGRVDVILWLRDHTGVLAAWWLFLIAIFWHAYATWSRRSSMTIAVRLLGHSVPQREARP